MKNNCAHGTIKSTLRNWFRNWPQECMLVGPGLLYFITVWLTQTQEVKASYTIFCWILLPSPAWPLLTSLWLQTQSLPPLFVFCSVFLSVWQVWPVYYSTVKIKMVYAASRWSGKQLLLGKMLLYRATCDSCVQADCGETDRLRPYTVALHCVQTKAFQDGLRFQVTPIYEMH